MTQEEYLGMIETEPTEEMVVIKEEYRYIPISVIWAELRLIYKGNVKWEMLRETVHKDGVYGVGKLWYLPPIITVKKKNIYGQFQYPAQVEFEDQHNTEWMFLTGTAAVPITKKLRLSYPSLEAHCIMNAVKKIGPWFGSNLNKENEDKELVEDDMPVINVADERLIALIENAKTLEELGTLKPKDGLPDGAKAAYHKKLKTFVP